jgi:hypothetical protein
MWRVWGRGEVCTGFWWGGLRERGHWGDRDVDGTIILRLIFRKEVGGGCGDWMESQRVPIVFVTVVYLSIRIEQSGSHYCDFRDV